MPAVTNFDSPYNEKHPAVWLDVIRIIVGLAIIAKGIIYITDTRMLEDMLNDNFNVSYRPYATGIAVLYLIGGLLVMCGFATRIACLMLTFLICATLLFVYRQIQTIAIFELVFSTALLIGVITFLIKGAGKLSVHYFVFL